MVEQVVHIDIVNISLNVFEINIIFVSLPAGDRAVVFSIFVTITLILIFLFLIRLVFIGLFKPGVRKNLRYRQALFWF